MIFNIVDYAHGLVGVEKHVRVSFLVDTFPDAGVQR